MSKILIVGPAYPLRGGLATYNERLAQSFKEMGHECDILSFSLQYPDFLFPGKTQFSTDRAPADISIHSDINSINPLNWISVGLKMKHATYDIVVFRYWMSFMAPAFGTIARIIKQNKHTRILAITDNLIPHEKRFFDTPFTRYFLPVCDGFLTMSHSVKEQLQQWTKRKPIVYTPHPMYDMFGAKTDKRTAREKLQLDPEFNYLLFFGFIRKYKGLSLLLDVFALDEIRKRKLKLIVAGEFYEDAKPYLDQVEALNLNESVVLRTDFIPNSEVATYFSAADAVIQPYLNATQSGVTQIAYFYDKPMIVTNVGGLAELVPDDQVGFVVNVDKTELAHAIVRFYDQQKETEFTRNMSVEKQKFTWQTLCNHLLDLAK